MKTHHFSTALSTSLGKPNRFPSPAKLNLFLYINGKLPNGYHELQTLFQFLDFGDWLTIDISQDRQIHITPEIPGLPLEQNLIYRAATLLQEKTGCTLGATIHLDKILPMGGGIGGGSSNAATTLLALNYLWQTHLSIDELAELGLKLGADVPIFVHGQAAFAEGVGEKIQYCEPQEKYYVVLKPETAISTAVVFSDPDLSRNTEKRSARLTGTGACVFAEFDDEKSAQAVFQQKPKEFFGFVAKGLNVSPLHAMLKQLSTNQSIYTQPEVI